MKIDPVSADRVVLLLENLTKENHGWRRWISRWKISDEPLRGDAANILAQLRRIEMNQVAFDQMRECSEKYAHIKPRC